MEERKNKKLLIVGVACLLVVICIVAYVLQLKKGEKKPDIIIKPVQKTNYLYEYGLLTNNQISSLEEKDIPTSSTPNNCNYKLENKKIVYSGKIVAEDVESYICDNYYIYYLNDSNELYYVERQGDLNTSYLLAKNVIEFRTVTKKDDYKFAVYSTENGYDIHKRFDYNRDYLIYKNIDGKEYFIDNVDNKSMEIKYINHVDLYCSTKEISQIHDAYNSDEIVVNIVNDKSIVKNILKDENGNDLTIKDALMSSDIGSNGEIYNNEIYVLDKNNYLYVFDFNSVKTLKGKKVDESKVSKYVVENSEAQESTTITFESGKELVVSGVFVFEPKISHK